LSRRELDVLTLLAYGNHNGEIAQQLIISEETVKSHVKQIISKLHARNRTHAVMIAAQQRLLPIGPAS
jgi:DNA-binding NarL/FixJ family response regulator